MERSETVITIKRPRAGSAAEVVGRALQLFAGRAPAVIARLCFCAFFLVTSVYCLLAYIPFTHQWVISFALVGWLPAFVKLHPYLYWLALGPVAATLAGDVRHAETRRLARGFLLVHGGLGIWLLFRPALAGIQNDGVSFVWSLAWLFPILWLGAIDYTARSGAINWGRVEDRDRQTLLAAVLTALFVTMLQAGLSYARPADNASEQFQTAERLAAIGLSAASHLFAFGLLFVALKLINAASKLSQKSAKLEFLLSHLLAGAVCALIVRKVILPAIAFNNILADVFSVAAGLSIAVFLMALSMTLHRAADAPVRRGFELALMPVTLPGLSRMSGIGFWLALAAALSWAVPAVVATRDWDFLLQKLAAVAAWPFIFAAFYKLASRARNKQYNLIAVVLIAALIIGAYKFAQSSRLAFFGRARSGASAALDRYSSFDVSLRAVREVLSEVTDDGALYDYLREYTNILPLTRVAPVEVNLVEELKQTEALKPNIFVFVVDSLRRDYLSPYNKSVSFTPNIERFARESVVMENAFTRYGGTALSEPAIWSGSMLLHKQYVLPFYPMNSLQKLLDVDRYQSFISMDPILSELLRPSSSISALDKRGDGHDFDFCWTLKELEKKIDDRKTAEPLFAYAQPWNIHAHVIATEGRTVSRGEEYSGFWAPYASRVKYMDACLGEFIDYLKTRGLYENSIVILTSDHGDSLGEGGRWGHSYWMYPEIIRVPLIIHLPEKLRAGLVWDSQGVAFTTDITPSLYYLLGHRPVVKNDLFGKPLFTATEKELREYQRDSWVVASSYGAVYGVLSGNGRWLFLADAVRNKDYFYDLASEGRASFDNFTSAKRAEQQQFIREYIGSINKFYGLKEKPQTAGAFDMGRQGRPASEQ